MVDLDNEQIQKLVDDIYYNRCMLFLGPMLGSLRQGQKYISRLEIMSNFVKEILERDNISYSKEKNASYYYLAQKLIKHAGTSNAQARFKEIDKSMIELFGKSPSNTKIGPDKTQKSFEEPSDKVLDIQKCSPLYRILSELPFNTIVNFGSDTLMHDALKRQRYDHHFHYYHFNAPADKSLDTLPPNAQLVYNLLGSDKDDSSKILTETDWLEFTHAILKRQIPPNVLSRFADSGPNPKSFVFLGFDFEEWPFRFLLKLFNIEKNKQSISTRNLDANVAVLTEEFYNDSFKMQFLNQATEQFVTKMVTSYRKKYDTATSEKIAYISYHQNEHEFVNDFKQYLESPKFKNKIKFVFRDELFNDVKSETFLEKIGSIDIYIPFLSTKFLVDFSKEFDKVFTIPKIHVYPIVARECRPDDYIENFSNIVRYTFPKEGVSYLYNYSADKEKPISNFAKGNVAALEYAKEGVGEIYLAFLDTIKKTIR